MVCLLNPGAPEFFPSHSHKLQQQQQQQEQLQPRPFPTSPVLTPHDYFFYLASSFPLSQPHPSYYPTTALPPPPTPPPSIPLALEAEPTLFKDENHGLHHKKKDHVGLAELKRRGGSKRFVQKPVYMPRVSSGKFDGRRLDSFRMKGYPPRRKAEEHGQRQNVDFSRNRSDEQYCRVSPKRKPRSPLMPVKVDGNETTVMIKNIPSKYTREMLVEFLEDHCLKVNCREREACKEKGEEPSGSAFDFVYLPIDFISGMNKGYAFVNFTKPQAAWKFSMTASNMKWDFFQSHKIREVVSARLQGKEQLEKHFETMNFPYDSEDVLPVSFSPSCDGVIKGNRTTVGKLTKRQHV